ncbi:hypothetical protein Elgi_37730 [Paenibacillus elgii]|uniref:hypothetical protein n=1 Tax=Paenibacillus elgii TaxID=189691 RepID=UPI002D7D1CC4|nr:hypothetical protein Elgi_37730 [Paenibacillus elgii]
MKYKVVNTKSKYYNQIGKKYGQLRSHFNGEMIHLLEFDGEEYEGFSSDEIEAWYE